MKENKFDSYILGEYTIQYTGNDVRLLEIKTNGDFGIMFTSNNLDEFFGMMVIKEDRLSIKNLELNAIEHFKIHDKVVDISFKDFL